MPELYACNKQLCEDDQYSSCICLCHQRALSLSVMPIVRIQQSSVLDGRAYIIAIKMTSIEIEEIKLKLSTIKDLADGGDAQLTEMKRLRRYRGT
jgi:hypothetical protein